MAPSFPSPFLLPPRCSPLPSVLPCLRHLPHSVWCPPCSLTSLHQWTVRLRQLVQGSVQETLADSGEDPFPSSPRGGQTLTRCPQSPLCSRWFPSLRHLHDLPTLSCCCPRSVLAWPRGPSLGRRTPSPPQFQPLPFPCPSHTHAHTHRHTHTHAHTAHTHTHMHTHTRTLPLK